MVNACDCRFDEASPVSTGRQLSYDRSTRLRMFAATDKKLEPQRTQRFTVENYSKVSSEIMVTDGAKNGASPSLNKPRI